MQFELVADIIVETLQNAPVKAMFAASRAKRLAEMSSPASAAYKLISTDAGLVEV